MCPRSLLASCADPASHKQTGAHIAQTLVFGFNDGLDGGATLECFSQGWQPSILAHLWHVVSGGSCYEMCVAACCPRNPPREGTYASNASHALLHSPAESLTECHSLLQRLKSWAHCAALHTPSWAGFIQSTHLALFGSRNCWRRASVLRHCAGRPRRLLDACSWG